MSTRAPTPTGATDAAAGAAGGRRPPPGVALWLLSVAAACVVLWWVWRAVWPARVVRPPLRRTVDLAGTRGVRRRWRVSDPEAGRRLLVRLGDAPAALVPGPTGWVVWSGPQLTLTPVGEEHPAAVLVEFTVAGRPFLRAADAKADPDAADADGAGAGAAAADAALPPLRTLPGNAIDLARVPEPGRIRAFGTLAAAARAARVGPDARGEVDHIVGGSAAHPVYYVVPARVGADAGPQGAAAVVAGSGFDQQVWVRAAPAPAP